LNRLRINVSQPVERFVNLKNLVRWRGHGDVRFLRLVEDFARAPLESQLATRAFHDDPPHCFGSRREEVSSAVPLRSCFFGDAEPGFVNQSRRLNGLSRRLRRHFGSAKRRDSS